jgi:hypothetical protein
MDISTTRGLGISISQKELSIEIYLHGATVKAFEKGKPYITNIGIKFKCCDYVLQKLKICSNSKLEFDYTIRELYKKLINRDISDFNDYLLGKGITTQNLNVFLNGSLAINSFKGYNVIYIKEESEEEVKVESKSKNKKYNISNWRDIPFADVMPLKIIT